MHKHIIHTSKQFQFQSMASELNMYESQVNEYKYEIERIARELQEVKKKYFMQKKKEQSQKLAFLIHVHTLLSLKGQLEKKTTPVKYQYHSSWVKSVLFSF